MNLIFLLIVMVLLGLKGRLKLDVFGCRRLLVIVGTLVKFNEKLDRKTRCKN